MPGNDTFVTHSACHKSFIFRVFLAVDRGKTNIYLFVFYTFLHVIGGIFDGKMLEPADLCCTLLQQDKQVLTMLIAGDHGTTW